MNISNNNVDIPPKPILVSCMPLDEWKKKLTTGEIKVLNCISNLYLIKNKAGDYIVAKVKFPCVILYLFENNKKAVRYYNLEADIILAVDYGEGV